VREARPASEGGTRRDRGTLKGQFIMRGLGFRILEPSIQKGKGERMSSYIDQRLDLAPRTSREMWFHGEARSLPPREPT